MQEDDLPGLSSNLLTGCALFVKSGVDISKSFTHNFEDYYLGQIIQGDFDNKMQSEIDEIGTAAEALTSAVLKVKEIGAVEEKSVVYFYADHPFAYIIADPFGNYCFMGTFWGK
jgi:serpin B